MSATAHSPTPLADLRVLEFTQNGPIVRENLHSYRIDFTESLPPLPAVAPRTAGHGRGTASQRGAR